MKFLKWSLFFVASFLISWILITTFSQEAFRQPVSARVFAYQTIAIAIYWYVIGAFAAGLLIGLFVAVYNYINCSTRLRKRNRQIRALEEERDRLQMQATMNKPESRTHPPSIVSPESPSPAAENEPEIDADDLGDAGHGEEEPQ
jgi:uncharacterized membrane protein YciS (DUF1049 family)